MGEPFVLCYGKFAGKAIEAMMFDSKGYEYLDHQAVRNGDENQFVLRVRRLVARGETPRIVARCQCGASATHVSRGAEATESVSASSVAQLARFGRCQATKRSSSSFLRSFDFTARLIRAVSSAS